MASSTPGVLTPMMQQYLDIKGRNENCILFFRLGDFYEMFFEDAITASKELDIVLTGRDCGQEQKAPMCGIPYHSADSYIAKLVEKGYNVAVCEQTEDPKLAKSLVKREVIRVVTPGTVIDASMLDEGKNNYIACLFQDKRGFGLALADVTTGEFAATSFPIEAEKRVLDEIAKFQPAEIILNEAFSFRRTLEGIFSAKTTVRPDWTFSGENAFRKLTEHFRTLNLLGFGMKENDLEANAAGAMLEFLSEMQKSSLAHISSIRKYSHQKCMVLDLSSRRNLELTETIRDKSKKNSLLGVLDQTKTALGARALRRWIEQPLVSVKDIALRLDSVEELKMLPILRGDLRGLLASIHDMERIMAKVVYQTANCRDLVALKNSVKNLPAIKSILSDSKASLLARMHSEIDSLEDIWSAIEKTLTDDPPFSVRDGGFIRSGFSAELDRLREAKESGSQWLADLESKEKLETGIKNLKIRYNKVFGYYIEISNSNIHLAPQRYVRRQTLANCERYVTDELKKIEDEILGADEKITDLEYSLFVQLRSGIAEQVLRIQKAAASIAALDALQSLAEVADRCRYCKPVVDNSGIISISEGRHPVVEQMAGAFIPNDTELDLNDNRLAIITGPNMAGKSTYMRQVALLVLMAQAGSFIPADRARIGIVDRIFTRVGAADDLASGQSTFMVEMNEVANILNNSSKRSLLVLDEIGRGTSTFDGLSIAWAVLEYIADISLIGAKTLFATHYHELTELEGKIDGVKNYCVKVLEQGDDIIFLRKIARGGADHSYGIQVARLAGLPEAVLERSKEILADLNSNDIARKTPLKTEAIRPYKRKKIRVPENQMLMQDVFGSDMFPNETSVRSADLES
ncbi:MAG: DNA mismatch repair protein MutS [Clostridiales bacterium]|nr:DNA mismatch repair protein MutS [Clostridiales bacterium]